MPVLDRFPLVVVLVSGRRRHPAGHPVLRQEPRQGGLRGVGDLRRRGRRGRGQGGAQGGRRLPARPQEVRGAGGRDPQGRATGGPAGLWQDAPGQGSGR